MVDAVQRECGTAYTRQALSKHDAIRLAYASRRDGAPCKPGARPVSKALAAATARAARLEAAMSVARRREDLLLETIARYMYNAHAHGMADDALGKPLPVNHRR